MEKQKPRVYVGRIPYGWGEHEGGGGWNYINEGNMKRLAEFAEPVLDDSGPRIPGEHELLGKLEGVKAILLPNGDSGIGITESVLRKVGSVEVVVVAHSAWHGPCWDDAIKLGIKVAEGSNAIDRAVAEWTIASAIMGRRDLIAAGRSLKEEGLWQNNWRRASLLMGSTVGVLGLGRIGRLAASHFISLGAKVMAYDKYIDPDKAAAMNIKLVSLDALLQEADVVSLHLPVTPETTGILGKREFELIKDGAVFVNSARAALYDHEALAKELAKQRFQAFFDVYPDENAMHDDHGHVNRNHPFFAAVHNLDNVYMSSHIAGTNDAMYSMAGDESVEVLSQYFEGRGLLDARGVI
ncbi:MAG: hypothetical protein JXR97_10535 [Planctomycetes bacterium]|nr:hypothetical protein [Planctomycetota bacterium]